jgi:competence ComEA-like helix-hairpin-helix protein
MKYRNIWLQIKEAFSGKRWQRRLKFFCGVCLCIVCFYLFDVLKAAPSEQTDIFAGGLEEAKTTQEMDEKSSKSEKKQTPKAKQKVKEKVKQTGRKEPAFETKTMSKKELIEQRAGKININEADKETLMEIPYVGEKKADDIIAYRADFPFTVIEDLMEVKGIGQKTFEKIAPFITV